ncbi:glycosyltransferase family 2 protein [Nevskia sp.]|uniref:glycosyltransferase family 2 protein n=1 Tax=Nevskia sp. TaxID=1929292 RepID=UPI0025F1AF5B|nr:glycosyltransferase family 2 protein [Nevskia sp.]
MTLLLAVLLFAVAIPAVFSCGYLLLFTVLSAPNPVPPTSSKRLRFDVIVPAHNESAVIERTVASLLKLDWPRDRFRPIVVADNCSDDTAALARAAGATVLERFNTELRGKGYALDHAFSASRREGWADAVVIIDADAEVSPNTLEAFACRIERGAQAVQVHYGILNPMASWRTRLLTIAKASFHIVRSRARERLGLSCGIRGNGWCVTHRLLVEVPYKAFSLTEDLEYGITLGLAGHRVHYADEAHSDADMVTSSATAGKQRQRWEDGRFALIREKTGTVLKAAIARRSKVCLDLACDLLVLPLSYVALNAVALTVLAIVGLWLAPALGTVWLWLGLGCTVSIVLYVLRGWQLSGLGRQGLIDLARAPFFIAWKVVLMLRRRDSGWVRTDRETPP